MDIITFLIYLGILFLLFLVIREIVCWYFKLNEIIPLLKSIDGNLKQMNQSNEPQRENAKAETKVQDPVQHIKIREISGKQKALRAIGLLAIIAASIILAKYLG